MNRLRDHKTGPTLAMYLRRGGDTTLFKPRHYFKVYFMSFLFLFEDENYAIVIADNNVKQDDD